MKKIEELICAIDDIDNFEDYKAVFNEIVKNKFCLKIATGATVEEIVDERINEWIDIRGEQFDLENTESPFDLGQEERELDISHYESIQYFISYGFTCRASYCYSKKTGCTYGLNIDLDSYFDDGSECFINIHFEDLREFGKKIYVSSCFGNKNLPKFSMPYSMSSEDLYHVIDIIETLETDFPDPTNIERRKINNG